MKKTDTYDSDPETEAEEKRKKLRTGFSTGTAATAAARAALRHWLTGEHSQVVAVRLPLGYFLPVRIHASDLNGEGAWAAVIKDAGDDPDVTHRAEIRVGVRLVREVQDQILPPDSPCSPCASRLAPHGIYLVAGTGVGVVTKPGLPVKVGEPAVNPGPRSMLVENLAEELRLRAPDSGFQEKSVAPGSNRHSPHAFLPFNPQNTNPEGLLLEVEIQVPRGKELARHTLNPRLGIEGGISILGTTGLVKPFSHQAYEETIQAALSVAASNGCERIVLSTGGKSERFAQALLPDWPTEAFVQIADFFAFAVQEARKMGFKLIVHSVFFGKAVKMAQGHAYTHAHKVNLDLNPLARLAEEKGHPKEFCRELASANTARHALELLLSRRETDIVHQVAEQAVEQSVRIAGKEMAVGLFLFDYDGTLLVRLDS